MKWVTAAHLVIMLFVFVSPHANAADTAGFLCIAPIPEPNAEPLSLSNPAGGGRDFRFSIQVDDGDAEPLPLGKSTSYGNLSLHEEHLIVVKRGGEIVESFRFHFEHYKSNRLCLWFKALYETWSLWSLSEARHICGCK